MANAYYEPPLAYVCALRLKRTLYSLPGHQGQRVPAPWRTPGPGPLWESGIVYHPLSRGHGNVLRGRARIPAGWWLTRNEISVVERNKR